MPCPNIDINKIFDTPGKGGDLKFRFFNQPIEQIPGFDEAKPQLLAHRPNYGLQWVTVDQCLPVVTCLDLEDDKIKVQRKALIIIKDFEMGDDTECDIDINKCENI